MTNTVNLVWNGCDMYQVSNESIFKGSQEFKPFPAVEVDLINLPVDEDGSFIVDGVLVDEDGKYYKAI